MKTQDGQTQDARLEPRPLDQVKELVRGWAAEARELARLKAELSVWLMKRRAITAAADLAEGEKAVELLLLECELRDRVAELLDDEQGKDENV
jgi:hypothetical protein